MDTSPEPAGIAGHGSVRSFATLRRLYLYLVVSICLIVLQVHFRGLAGDLATYWGVLDGQYRLPVLEPLNRRLLEKGSFLLTAALFLVVHYGLVLGWIRRDPQELDSSVRKLFLFVATLVALGYCMSLVAGLIAPALRRLMGMGQEVSGFHGANYAALALQLGLSGAILVQSSRLLYAERHRGLASVRCQALEAVFFASANVAGFLLLASVVHMGLSRALIPLLLRNTPPSYVPWAASVAAASALLLGLHQVACWRLRLGQGRSHAWGNVLHTLVLYGGLLIGLVTFLYGLVSCLQVLLALLDESSPGTLDVGIQLASALSTSVPLGVGYWLWFRRSLARAPETARLDRWRTVPRQLYLYSGIGVALFWVAAGSQALLLPLLEPDRDLAWTELAQLLIGGPALFLLWRQIRRSGAEPAAPASRLLYLLPRRLYLYGVTIVSTLTLFFFSGQVLRGALARLLGWEDTFGVLSARDSATLIVMAVVLAVHVRLLRQPWGAFRAAASQEAAMMSLRQELAAAYEQQRRATDRIRTLERKLAELSPPTSTTEYPEP